MLPSTETYSTTRNLCKLCIFLLIQKIYTNIIVLKLKHEAAPSHQWHPTILTGLGQTPLEILPRTFCHCLPQWEPKHTLLADSKGSWSKFQFLFFLSQGFQEVNSILLSSLSCKQSVTFWQKISTHFTCITKQKKQNEICNKWLVHHQDLTPFSSLFIPAGTSWTKTLTYHTILMALPSSCPQLKAASFLFLLFSVSVPLDSLT